jgi:hypothetical protein
MILRRRASVAPRKIIGIRAGAIVLGLVYVLSTTDTLQAFSKALAAINLIGETIQKISGSTPNTDTAGKNNE